MRRRTFVQSLVTGGLSTGFGLKARSISSGSVVEVPQIVNGQVEFANPAVLPPPQESGLNHIVVVTMENRSFDHFLGWLPGATGQQAGLTYYDPNNVPHATYALAPGPNPQYTGCPQNDPDHSYTGARITYADGAMNGFLKDTSNDEFCIGYYGPGAQPYFEALAQNYLVCDSWFASILGPTFPNRLFLWAAQTDRLTDSVALTSLPTIFDRLSAANVSHRYFFNNLPFTALWGIKYVTASSLFAQFQLQAELGLLPSVSFIDPLYTILDDGTGNDDHPHADIRNGEHFLSAIVNAIYNSPHRHNTAIIIMFDEWGGFFETVPPPRVPPGNKTIDTDTDSLGNVLLGFRIPPIIVSPWTRNTGANPLVDSTLFDHTSVLKLIEWRFGLEPLTPRDAAPQIGNLATVMNFSSPDYSMPSLPSASSVVAAPCFGGGIFSASASVAGEGSPAPQGTEWAAFQKTAGVQSFLAHPQFREQ